MMYAIWAFRKYPDVDIIEGTYVYVEHNTEHKYIFKREYLQNYVDSYSKKIVNIEREKEYPKNINRLCEWCDFQSICDKD